jgi:hypothetical protein
VLVRCYIVSYKTVFGKLLNVVNVIRFRCTLNFLLLTTLTVMDIFSSEDNERGSSKDNETVSS